MLFPAIMRQSATGTVHRGWLAATFALALTLVSAGCSKRAGAPESPQTVRGPTPRPNASAKQTGNRVDVSLPNEPQRARDGLSSAAGKPASQSIHAAESSALPPANAEPVARNAFALEQEYGSQRATIERRGEIIGELAQLDTAPGMEALRRLFDRERREELRLGIVSAIGAMENEQLLTAKLDFFSRATEPKTPRLIREVSAIALSELDDPGAEALLRRLQSDPDAELRATVRQLLRDR